MKKRGFGMGKWNGFGGKLKDGEIPEQAATRELQEECGAVAIEIQKVAEIYFENSFKPENNMHCHVFLCTKWEGEIIETEEMNPQWFEYEKIPFEKMWSDDKHWYTKMLTGERFKAKFEFDANDQMIKERYEVFEG